MSSNDREFYVNYEGDEFEAEFNNANAPQNPNLPAVPRQKIARNAWSKLKPKNQTLSAIVKSSLTEGMHIAVHIGGLDDEMGTMLINRAWANNGGNHSYLYLGNQAIYLAPDADGNPWDNGKAGYLAGTILHQNATDLGRYISAIDKGLYVRVVTIDDCFLREKVLDHVYWEDESLTDGTGGTKQLRILPQVGNFNQLQNEIRQGEHFKIAKIRFAAQNKETIDYIKSISLIDQGFSIDDNSKSNPLTLSSFVDINSLNTGVVDFVPKNKGKDIEFDADSAFVVVVPKCPVGVTLEFQMEMDLERL